MIEETQRGRRVGITLQVFLLRAVLHSIQGDITASLGDLERSLELGEPEGYVRTFIDEGPAIATLLREKGETGGDTPYLRKLQEALLPTEVKAETRPAPTAPGGTGALIEELSERELEVLALIAEGLKYGDIAERLVISVNTVRFHVKSIYGKLNVNNRTQAVERARSLGVL
jgi:LuxR family maltose regulon positive regulatory protein